MQTSLFDDHQEPQILQQCSNDIHWLSRKQKEFSLLLLQPGFYCRTRMNNNNESVYIVYSGKQEPVKMFSRETGDALKFLFKKSSSLNYSFNLNKIRMLDGRSFLKRSYKRKFIKNEP